METSTQEDNNSDNTWKCGSTSWKEYGPREFWEQKHRVEQIYGKFYEENPAYDMVNDQHFDREAMYELVQQIHHDANIETGGISLSFEDLSIQVPVEILPEVKTVETTALAPWYKLSAWLKSKIYTRKAKQGKGASEDPEARPERDSINPNQSMENFLVLDKVSGFVKAGESLLILSPPASGSSSLLNILALRGGHFKNMQGKVMYNGLDAYQPSLIKVLRHLVRVIGQEDIHFASLTVYHTLRFAAHCMYPSFFPYAEYLRESKVFGVARALGIERTLETVVGDNILRGVSGGEKKRVTIAEMMVGFGGRLYFLDNFTSGLDSAASYDICESITKLARANHVSFICSLQQPSAEMFFLFDRLLVLDHGKALFFGKPSQAQSYFESLGFIKPPFRSVPDFISTVSYPKASESLVDPEKIDTAPRTLEEFEQRYHESDYYRECIQEIHQGVVGRSQRFQGDAKTKTSPNVWKWFERDCLNPSAVQMYLLFVRALRLELLDLHSLATTLISNIIVGLVLGTLFFNMPLNQEGLYSRGGLLALSLIHAAMSPMGTISAKYSQKRVFEKQTAAGFHTAMPYIVASTLVEILVSLIRVLLFSVCIYWLAGFHPSAGRFGIFILVMWMSSMVIDAFVRLLSVTMSQDACTASAGAIVVMFIVFSGYLLPPDDIPPWFIWLFYLSPLQYATESLFINELYGLTFTCTPSELLPPDPSLVAVAYCPWTDGQTYSTDYLGWNNGFFWIWIDLAIMVGFWLFFLAVSTFILYRTKPKEYGYRRLNDSTSQDDREIVERRIRQAHKAYRQLSKKLTGQAEKKKTTTKDCWPWRKTDVPGSGDDLDGLPDLKSFATTFEDNDGCEDNVHESEAIKVKPAFIVWKDISYTVPIGRKENKTLLSHINGYARPGKMIALMGSSGAGKTTLLDVLAQRKTKGKISGTIEINRALQDEYFSRYSGYVEQMDIHYERLTVRESLLFAAQMRLPDAWDKHVKEEIVDRTISTLMLDDLKDRLVGAPGGLGLSAEARKRLTIAVELVGNPSVIFLDEPTTGLSAREALMVIRVIRRVANMGVSVICTIHQPSSEIFSEFDELLLLQRGGETVYFGEIGPGGETLVDYFVRNGAPAPGPNQNPAEYMLLQIGAGVLRMESSEVKRNWQEIWNTSPEAQRLEDVMNDMPVDVSEYSIMKRKTAFMGKHSIPTEKAIPEDGSHATYTETEDHTPNMRYIIPQAIEPLKFDSRFTTSRKYQFRKVSERALLMAWRTPEQNWTRFVVSIVQAVVLGLAFLQIDNNQQGVALMPAAMFLSGLTGSLQMSNVIRPLMASRDVFYRELAAGLYNEFAYHVSTLLCELPFLVLAALIFQVIYYFLIGFTAARFGYFVLANMLFTLWTVFVGQTIAAYSANISSAMHIPPLINTLGNVLAGFLIRRQAIGWYYRWLYYINPFMYYNSGVLVNELSNQSFYCDPSEYVLFANPNPGQSCSDLSNGPFVYFNGPNPNTCEYCPVSNGNVLLTRYGVGEYNNWINIAALAAFAVFFQFLTLGGLLFSKHIDR
eukprot:CAMPEP_0184699786 /NCGR_PEP_ID=MMETSP0313-20130426/5909_1 /TAXON_ID=2792 /ORGANISM="Porphyridium aerugineum, Strain SAG 1380-2" /LENGTH=1538 /DNA_ID=CAMNT_0027158911 /DNA_START=204 /DNA_END=4820 /DNA_ORIENTATION=-